MTQGAGGESVVGYVDLIGHDCLQLVLLPQATCNWEFPDDPAPGVAGCAWPRRRASS